MSRKKTNSNTMKKYNYLVALLLISMSSSLLAQSFPDPEFSARPYTLAQDNSLKSIERADAQVDFKVKGMGIGGSEIYYTTFSPKSEVRFSKDALPRLIIKVDGNADPSELISMAKGEVKKDRRRFLQGSMALAGKARDVSSAYIKLEFKKLRDGIYEIILPSDIQSGEYAFMPMNSGEGNPLTSYNSKVKIACFGID